MFGGDVVDGGVVYWDVVIEFLVLDWDVCLYEVGFEGEVVVD